MGFLLGWRLWLLLGALAAFVVFVGLALHWREDAARQRARADSAVLQSGVDTSTAAIADRVASDRVIIIQKAEETARAVEAIPSDDIPADVRSAWLDGLRNNRAGGPDPDGTAELPGAVSGTEP